MLKRIWRLLGDENGFLMTMGGVFSMEWALNVLVLMIKALNAGSFGMSAWYAFAFIVALHVTYKFYRGFMLRLDRMAVVA